MLFRSDVTDQRVLAAMQSVPREQFVGAGNAAIAYSDGALTVKGAGESRKLLTPMVLARLIQAADVTPQCRVLDVGGGAGYSAAVLARLAGQVVAVESVADLSQQAGARFRELGIANAVAVSGPLEAGRPQDGPFDVILLNGAIEQGLETLLGQLKPGGRLVCIRRAPGQSGLAAKATRYDNAAGRIGGRALFDAAGAVLAPFAGRPEFAF